MATVITERDGLRVKLTRGERWAALRRSDLLSPWNQVRSIEAVAEPFQLVHGLRAPGLSIPWSTKIGTWRSQGRKIFAVTQKGLPGVRIRLHGNVFDEILLSVADSAALVAQINSRLG